MTWIYSKILVPIKCRYYWMLDASREINTQAKKKDKNVSVISNPFDWFIRLTLAGGR